MSNGPSKIKPVSISLSRRDRLTTAECGCVLEDAINVTFFHYCHTHAAAQDLFALVVEAHRVFCGCQTMGEECSWPEGRTAIRKARSQ